MNILTKTERIKTHEITALENLEQYYKSTQKNNSSLNIYLETDVDSARKTAENIDSRIKKGNKVGKLAMVGVIAESEAVVVCAYTVLFTPKIKREIKKKIISSNSRFILI